MPLPKAHNIRLFALLAIMPSMVMAGIALTGPDSQKMLAHGPTLSQHAGLHCRDCHQQAPGTVRQQLQAQFRHWMGQRETPVDFGYRAVAAAQCLDCHARPNERHPIYRFREPRFRAALEHVAAEDCLGCHAEHKRQMVTVQVGFCAACHEDLKLKSDPVEVPHHSLIAAAQWESCLTCHDYHGNHRHTEPTKLAEGLSAQDIRTYLQGGADPYGAFKTYEGKQP